VLQDLREHIGHEVVTTLHPRELTKCRIIIEVEDPPKEIQVKKSEL